MCVHLLPMELKCEIFTYLTPKDLMRLKLVDKTFKNDVEVEFPKYKAKLDAARHIELGLMKFKDRPIWQQVGLVGLCAVFSPVILVYYSPDIIRWSSQFFKPRLKQVIRAVGRAAKAVMNWVGTNLSAAAKWTYKNVLTPVGHGIQWTAEKAFQGLQWSYREILTPLGHGIRRVAQWTYEWVLTPLGHAIEKIFTHVIVPVCRFTFNEVIVPVARFLWKVVKEVFLGLKKVLTPVGKGLLRALKWSYNNIGIPAARIIWAIAKGILITLPTKIYRHVLTPIGHGISKVCQVVYKYLLTPLGKGLEYIYRNALVPIGHALHFAGRIVYEKVLTPLAILTYSLAHVVFVQLPLEAWHLVTTQVESIRRRFS